MNSKDQHEDHKVNIEILGKSYQIKCDKEKVGVLHEAAARLNKEMQMMRRSGVVGMERIAVITALNLASQVNQLEKNVNSNVNVLNGRIVEMQKRIDDALTQVEQLEL